MEGFQGQQELHNVDCRLPSCGHVSSGPFPTDKMAKNIFPVSLQLALLGFLHNWMWCQHSLSLPSLRRPGLVPGGLSCRKLPQAPAPGPTVVPTSEAWQGSSIAKAKSLENFPIQRAPFLSTAGRLVEPTGRGGLRIQLPFFFVGGGVLFLYRKTIWLHII